MLLSVAFALIVALGAAQVSGAKSGSKFDDPSYSPGEPATFDGLDDAQTNEKARGVVKHVQEVRSEVDAAERNGEITSDRANQIRADVNRKVEQTKSNYANRKRPQGSNQTNGSNGSTNGNGKGKGNGNGGTGRPTTPSAGANNGNPVGNLKPGSPGTAPGAVKKPKKRSGVTKPAPRTQSPTTQQPVDGDSPGEAAPAPVAGGSDGSTVGSQGAAVGVAGAYASVTPAGRGERGAGRDGTGGATERQRLQALIDGTADSDVSVDVADSRRMRELLTQATTGVPLGYQALLMGLLFIVALLLVLVLRERRRAQHVERVSQLDYLTGLANREGFDRMLGIEWRRAMRYGHTLGIVFIDLDDFKRFNDTNGHLAGDRLLREVAAVINSEARASDYTARLGGDEFVILCPETDAGGLEALARRLETASVGLAVSLSIGFTHQLPTDTAAEDLVGRADAAMYQAKAERGSIVATGPAKRK